MYIKLIHANLKRTDMSGVILKDSDLRNADLSYASLICAILNDANLKDVNLICSSLKCANLNHANLFHANLKFADIRFADLSNAYLNHANLECTDLRGANLENANLSDTNLKYVDLANANLKHAYLINADLNNSNLNDANLKGADLTGTNLSNTDLMDANLEDIKTSVRTIGYGLACPEEGSFIGYKKASEYIIKLLILDDSKRSSATSLKCRCDKAKVLDIENICTGKKVDYVCSDYDKNFIYKVGETVHIDNFDDNRWKECTNGIHFFINKNHAIHY